MSPSQIGIDEAASWGTVVAGAEQLPPYMSCPYNR